MISDIASMSGNNLSTKDALQLLCAIPCNAHHIVNNDQQPVALGLFPLTCMMNHSCVPNCAHYFVVTPAARPQLVMVAVEDIAEGVELTYSYSPLYQSTAERQSKLMAAYGFRCDCLRCESQTAIPGDLGLSYPLDVEISSSSIPSELQIVIDSAAELGTGLEFLRLLALLEDRSTLGGLSVANGNVFRLYCSVCRLAAALLRADVAPERSEDEKVYLDLASRAAVGFGGLALGCISRFAKVTLLETAWLEDVVGLGLAGIPETEAFMSEAATATFEDLFAKIAIQCLSPKFVFASEPSLHLLLRAATCRAKAFWCTGNSIDSMSTAFRRSHQNVELICRGRRFS